MGRNVVGNISPFSASFQRSKRLDTGNLAGAQGDFWLVVQDELIVFQRGAQPVLHANAARELGIHLNAVMQVLLARDFRPFQCRFRILYQLVRFAPVLGVAGNPALDRHHDLASVDAERAVKYADDLVMQGARLIFGLLRHGAHADERAAAQVRKLLRVRILPFQAIRHALQQPISRMAAEGIIDDAQVIDVEDRQRKPRQALRAAR
jgi:hypothetical protein